MTSGKLLYITGSSVWVPYDDREGWDGGAEAGPKRAGMYVHLQLIHTIIQQKLTHYYKAIILQLNKSYDKPWELPRWHRGKESACQCRRRRKHGFDPWVRKIPGEGNGNPLQYSCQDNPMDR